MCVRQSKHNVDSVQHLQINCSSNERGRVWQALVYAPLQCCRLTPYRYDIVKRTSASSQETCKLFPSQSSAKCGSRFRLCECAVPECASAGGVKILYRSAILEDPHQLQRYRQPSSSRSLAGVCIVLHIQLQCLPRFLLTLTLASPPGVRYGLHTRKCTSASVRSGPTPGFVICHVLYSSVRTHSDCAASLLCYCRPVVRWWPQRPHRSVPV